MTTQTERLTLSVREAATLLGISETSAYAAVKAKQIPSLRFGRRVVVPRAALEKLMGMGETAIPAKPAVPAYLQH